MRPEHGASTWNIAALLEMLPPVSVERPDERLGRQRDHQLAQQRLAALAGTFAAGPQRAIDAALAVFNGTPGEPATFDRLHELLEQQPYRLAHWRTAFDEINYRRFFDVNDLGALRMEDPRVFDAAHALVLRLIAERTGHRAADRSPRRPPRSGGVLRAARARGSRGDGRTAARHADRSPFYILAEKILAHDELLPETGRSPARPATASSTRSTACSSIRATRRRSEASTRA